MLFCSRFLSIKSSVPTCKKVDTFVVFLHIGRIEKLRRLCVYLSLFSTPMYFLRNNIYLGALLWLCMLSKACICCGIGIGKKINVVEVMATKSEEEATPARLKFKSLLFQYKKFGFCL